MHFSLYDLQIASHCCREWIICCHRLLNRYLMMKRNHHLNSAHHSFWVELQCKLQVKSFKSYNCSHFHSSLHLCFQSTYSLYRVLHYMWSVRSQKEICCYKRVCCSTAYCIVIDNIDCKSQMYNNWEILSQLNCCTDRCWEMHSLKVEW